MKVMLFDAGILGDALSRGNPGIKAARVENIGLEYIGSIARNEGYDIRLYQNQKSYYELLQEIVSYNPDILAISTMTYQFPDALELTRDIKRLKPEIKTIFGGSHPSGEPSIVKEEAIDYAVIGEGEETFKELLIRLFNNEDATDIKGAAYSKNGEITINPPRARIKNINVLPSPIRDREIIKESKLFSPGPIPPSEMRIALMIYSRGCPYNCSYCVSPSMWNRKIIYRSLEGVLEEMEDVIKNYNPNFIAFMDLNFTTNKRNVKELCEKMEDRKIDIHWGFESTTDVNEDLLRAIKDAGCIYIAYGVESFDEDSLKALSRREDLSKVKEVIELTNDIGIPTHVFLMIDPRTANEETFQNCLFNLKETKPDSIRASFLTPFPGTILYKQVKEEGSLLTYDLRKFTTQEPILKGKMPPEELLKQRKKMISDYYNSEEYMKRVRENIKSGKVPKKSYEEFFNNLRAIGYDV